ncbi:hypothetical protein SBRY_50163 [Actinacidiphila bryophytorum]|uniref:Uncharacterized protein n=1 Tax=Actinacidiphila bryophytorum TaxID=1436133 RepID=A0A9W4H498_9ACTN|nr:hypothetical protein SBRY_50163 [Actinacidiphila bryophytorum]
MHRQLTWPPAPQHRRVTLPAPSGEIPATGDGVCC